MPFYSDLSVIIYFNNMLSLLIQNQLREMRRSPMWQRNLVINIIFGLFILYFMAIFAFLGFFIDRVLIELFPDSDPIAVFNGYLLLYFLADLGIRFFFDSLPTLSMKPLLHLPIKKKVLIHYLLVRSAFSVFNLWPLFLFIPFALKVVIPEYGIAIAGGWMFSILASTLTMNYLATYFKRSIASNLRFVLAFIGAIIALGVLEFLDIIELSVPSQAIWGFVLDMPVASLLFIIPVVGLYIINYRYIHHHTYLDELSTQKKQEVGDLKALGYLEGLGDIGRFMIIEMKLILRSKRPKGTLIAGIAFTLYGLIFFTNDIYADMWPMLLFSSLFITGGFVMSYSQFFFAWESSYFDGLLIHPMDTKKFLKAKFLMLSGATFIAYLVSLLYLFLDIKFFFLNTASALFNVGVTLFVMMWMATNNNKRLDVNQKATFNMQGSGITQFLAMVPALVMPAAIIYGFSYFDKPYIGLGLIALLGILGIIFHDALIDIIFKRLKEKKYYMAAGFRKQE